MDRFGSHSHLNWWPSLGVSLILSIFGQWVACGATDAGHGARTQCAVAAMWSWLTTTVAETGAGLSQTLVAVEDQLVRE